MRRIAAALFDATATACLGFAGFWVSYHATPCASVSECPPLAPIVVAGVIALVGGYYLLGYVLHRTTVGQWLMGVEVGSESSE